LLEFVFQLTDFKFEFAKVIWRHWQCSNLNHSETQKSTVEPYTDITLQNTLY